MLFHYRDGKYEHSVEDRVVPTDRIAIYANEIGKLDSGSDFECILVLSEDLTLLAPFVCFGIVATCLCLCYLNVARKKKKNKYASTERTECPFPRKTCSQIIQSQHGWYIPPANGRQRADSRRHSENLSLLKSPTRLFHRRRRRRRRRLHALEIINDDTTRVKRVFFFHSLCHVLSLFLEILEELREEKFRETGQKELNLAEGKTYHK